jgi:hypothetical protein
VNTLFRSVILVCGLSVAAFSQENYGLWSHYKNIAVNTKASGANVTAPVANFPVLVRLTSAQADVFSMAKAGGADIRFANAAGTHLPYQIERWDGPGQAAAIWVLADTVKGNDSTASLRMYWGRSAAMDSSNGAAVFSLANGFGGVWHFNEASGDTARDATGNLHAGTPSPTPPTDTLGTIGMAKRFSGNGATKGSFFQIDTGVSGPASLNVSSDTGPYTISAWVNPTSCAFATNRYTVVSKYNTSAGGARQFSLQGSDVGSTGTPGTWRMSNDPTSLPGVAGGGPNSNGNEF